MYKKAILNCLLLLSLIFGSSVSGQNKSFIREYNYTASETDSKVSSRRKALKEVKALLIEELGTYVESYVNYEIQEEDSKITKDFFTNEIKTLSAGTTETKVLAEDWDGYNYYIKAEIMADPEEVLRRINETLSIRKSNEEIDSLRISLLSADKELGLANSKLVSLKNDLNKKNREVQLKEGELIALRDQLNEAKNKLEAYNEKVQAIRSAVENIENEINKSSKDALSNVRLYMTTSEVKKVCGHPRAVDEAGPYTYYNYGSIWILFYGDLVEGAVQASCFEGLYRYKEYTGNCRIKLKSP